MNFKVLSLVSVLACAVGCGGSDEEETGTTSDDSADTDTSDDTSDETSDDTTDEGSDDTDTGSTTDEPDPVAPTPTGLPDPVLPDVPSDTPLSDLEDDELQEVCDAYIRTAEVMVGRMPGLCNLQGVSAGLETMSTDEATLRAACEVGRDSCADQAASAEDTVDMLTCGPANDCDATLEQFNECNRQIAAADQYLLGPLLELDAPECSELTATEAAALAAEAEITLLTGAISAGVAGGGLPSAADGPCAELEQQCPEFAAPYTSLSAMFTF